MQYFKHFFWIIIGLIFITISIKLPIENLVDYDLLPDTIGYIFITAGLGGLSGFSRAFSASRFFTVLLGLISIVTYGNISKQYFDLFAMQFTIVFGFLYTVCIFTFFILFLIGMVKLFYRYGLEDHLFSIITCFVFAIIVNVIASLSALPSLKELVVDSANGFILFAASIASAVWISARIWKSAAALENRFNEMTFIKNSSN